MTSQSSATVNRVKVANGPHVERILPPALWEILAEAHTLFEPRRQELLQARERQQARFEAGERPGFLEETRFIRDGTWSITPAPKHLQRRWVEITGPVERKTMINALNSGANCFMADFEDAHSPTWSNCLEGQVNLMDAVRGELEMTTPEGKHYKVGDKPAVLLVRPRGWHLAEKHFQVAGNPLAGHLFDAGVFLFHNAQAQLDAGQGPALYLPKLEHHLEANLCNDVLNFFEDRLGLPRNSVRVTVLIETLPAAFQMEEILWQLRGRIVGLNAGRWDYLFSVIKTLRSQPDCVLPDRAALTMETAFMQAYAKLIVATCHKRGAHAMGGMAAFIPNRRDAEVTANALRKVRADKQREVADGFDGTWVAHPDLVELARGIFDRHLRGEDNQLGRRTTLIRDGSRLLNFKVHGAAATEEGVRHNVRAALLYIESWLRGIGAVAIDNLMEDAATAEISRAQLWQWTQQGTFLADGRLVSEALVLQILEEEEARILEAGLPEGHRLDDAADLLVRVSLQKEFPPFLTLPAYERLEIKR
jgi:malate synthase